MSRFGGSLILALVIILLTITKYSNTMSQDVLSQARKEAFKF